MDPHDARLKALFAPDEPSAYDPAFSAVVLERLARRRCLQDLALLAAVSAVGGLALWAAWPVLEPALRALASQLAPLAMAGLLGLAMLAILGGQAPDAAAAES